MRHMLVASEKYDIVLRIAGNSYSDVLVSYNEEFAVLRPHAQCDQIVIGADFEYGGRYPAQPDLIRFFFIKTRSYNRTLLAINS